MDVEEESAVVVVDGDGEEKMKQTDRPGGRDETEFEGQTADFADAGQRHCSGSLIYK